MCTSIDFSPSLSRTSTTLKDSVITFASSRVTCPLRWLCAHVWPNAWGCCFLQLPSLQASNQKDGRLRRWKDMNRRSLLSCRSTIDDHLRASYSRRPQTCHLRSAVSTGKGTSKTRRVGHHISGKRGTLQRQHQNTICHLNSQQTLAPSIFSSSNSGARRKN